MREIKPSVLHQTMSALGPSHAHAASTLPTPLVYVFILVPLLILGMTGAFLVRSARRDAGQGPAGGPPGRRVASTAGNPVGKQVEPVTVPDTKFADVAGCDEAVEELSELVRFLSFPEEFEAVGAELPKGYLLAGPPGTGKTLLARAVAGEAGVPFFAMSASEFVETYVGIGAARIRSLFTRARACERAIIFIDEIDAIGRARGNNSNNANEERESALNQLLVEMDGFAKSSVIVLAATNRPDILDHALLRPGRFDQQITVSAPDRRGRSRILELYLKRRKIAPGIDVEMLGRRTPGFSGADLANLVNTAALIAVRHGAGSIGADDIDDALATVSLGPARKSRVVAERDRQITAWHEAGHALAGLWMKDAEDPVQVTIVPRGPAGGVTWFPATDADFMTLRQAKAQLVVAMSGRVAEELLLGDDFTQGASNDIRSATQLARQMVTDFGMGSLGAIYVQPEQQHIGYLAKQVHQSTRELLDEALAVSRAMLSAGKERLEATVTALLEEETLDTAALESLAGREPPAEATKRAA